jgi:oligosaccharide repeat unit polymerase
MYCLVGFSTTFFYDNKLLFKLLFIGFPVDDEYINNANLLFLIGLQSYLLGSLSKSNKIKKTQIRPIIISTKILSIGIIVLSIAFVALGGVSYYKAIYTKNIVSNTPGAVVYILILLLSMSITIIGTEFYNKKISSVYKINHITTAAIFILIGLLLWAGNRTAASQLFLPIICLYAMLFHKVNFKIFVLIILTGITTMWFFQQLRSNGSYKILSPIVLISDLTIPARTTYCALEYTDKYGYTYGKSMSMGIIGIVPFLPSLIAGESKEFGSAELLTDYTNTKHKIPFDYRIGLGTTIIGDIYLSFGLIGVILLMYLLGRFINRYLLRTLSMNYYAIVILAGMMANCVFLVRANYTHALRFVLWSLFIAYINKLIIITLHEKKDSNIYSNT